MGFVRGFLAAIVAVYILFVGAIWFTQTKFIFRPTRTVDETPGEAGVKFENVTLPLDGGQLAGWWVPAENPEARTLLYLHGNAGNIGVNRDHVLRLRSAGLNVLIIDYRGYGSSTGGPPREKFVYEDAERAWQHLVAERHIPPAHIAIYGHSLGGAVAIDLASRHPEAGVLITEATFTSIAGVAEGVPWTRLLPLRLVLTERFDSLSKIGAVHMPKLFLQGDADYMAPMARRLYDAAADPKQLAIIPDGGHETSATANPAAYFAALNGFLSQSHFR